MLTVLQQLSQAWSTNQPWYLIRFRKHFFKSARVPNPSSSDHHDVYASGRDRYICQRRYELLACSTTPGVKLNLLFKCLQHASSTLTGWLAQCIASDVALRCRHRFDQILRYMMHYVLGANSHNVNADSISSRKARTRQNWRELQEKQRYRLTHYGDEFKFRCHGLVLLVKYKPPFRYEDASIQAFETLFASLPITKKRDIWSANGT